MNPKNQNEKKKKEVFEEIYRKQNKNTKKIENREKLKSFNKGRNIKIQKTALKLKDLNFCVERNLSTVDDKRLISRHIIMKFLNTMNKVSIEEEII